MVETNYNIFLVVLSYMIAVFGSFTALQLAIRIPAAKESEYHFWLVGAAVSLGGGAIWAMHFIGMLAYNAPFEVRYAPALTLISLVLAVLVVGVGFNIMGRNVASFSYLLAAGTIAGLGVTGMHYLGMAAMIVPAQIEYDMTLVAISVAIAIVASTVAMWLAFNLRGNLQRFGSAFVMATAVCGMHYTGMTAVTMTPNNGAATNLDGSGIANGTLGIAIFVATIVVLGIFLWVSYSRAEQEAAAEQVIFDFE